MLAAGKPFRVTAVLAAGKPFSVASGSFSCARPPAAHYLSMSLEMKFSRVILSLEYIIKPHTTKVDVEYRMVVTYTNCHSYWNHK